MYAMLAPMGKSARDDASLLWLLDFAFTMSIQPDSTRTSIHPSPSMSQSTPSLIFPSPPSPPPPLPGQPVRPSRRPKSRQRRLLLIPETD